MHLPIRLNFDQVSEPHHLNCNFIFLFHNNPTNVRYLQSPPDPPRRHQGLGEGNISKMQPLSPFPARSLQLTNPLALTGSLPALLDTFPDHAGLSHELKIKTPYYSATVPIWVDTIPSTSEATKKDGEEEPISTLESWSDVYLSPEASEVLSVLGGIILTFRTSPTATLAALHKITAKIGHNWDGVLLAVSMAPLPAEEMEELESACLRIGFELVDFANGSKGGRNEYGEVMGMERVKEALEANDWMGGSDWVPSDEDEEGEGGDGVKAIGDEMEREMFGLHKAIFAGEDGDGEEEGEEMQVEKLEAVMTKLTMLKGISFNGSHSLASARLIECRHGRRCLERGTTEDRGEGGSGNHKVLSYRYNDKYKITPTQNDYTAPAST